MKTKLALKFGTIQVLSKEAQKVVLGGGPNSPCCPSSPYYSASMCRAYSGTKQAYFPGGFFWCGTGACTGAGSCSSASCNC